MTGPQLPQAVGQADSRTQSLGEASRYLGVTLERDRKVAREKGEDD